MLRFVAAQIFTLVLALLALLRQSDREKDFEILRRRQQLRMVERKQAQPPRISRWEKLSRAVLTAGGTSAWAKSYCSFSLRPS